MARYKVVHYIDASRLDILQQKLKDALGVDITTTVEKLKKSPSRADRLRDAEMLVSDAASIIEDLKNEVEEQKDNLPENLQGSSRAERLDDTVSTLSDLFDTLNDANFDVDFS